MKPYRNTEFRYGKLTTSISDSSGLTMPWQTCVHTMWLATAIVSPGQYAGNTRGTCRSLEDLLSLGMLLMLCVYVQFCIVRVWLCCVIGTETTVRGMQLVTSFCRHTCLLPSHQVSSRINMHMHHQAASTCLVICSAVRDLAWSS